MSTSYQKVQNNIYDPAHVPSLDGPGVALLLIQVAEKYDTTSAINASNPYADVIAKLSAAIPDSPLRREVFQVLQSRSDRYASGAQ